MAGLPPPPSNLTCPSGEGGTPAAELLTLPMSLEATLPVTSALHLVPPLHRLSLQDLSRAGPVRSRRLAKSTRHTSAWGQLKKLNEAARGIVERQQQVSTPETLFVAMLGVIACQVTSVNAA